MEAALQTFAKVDLLPVDNDSEKKKVAKKYKRYQIPRKLYHYSGPLHVMHKTNFY